MDSETGTLTRPDGTEIFWRHRPASSPLRAHLLLVHGMSEHSGRYERLFSHLAERGIECTGYDHRGHGRSGGEQGTVGDFADYLDDLKCMLERVRAEAPSGSDAKPVFMLAHSMGGLIATAYMLEREPKPDFLILSGPAIVPIMSPGDRSIDPTRLTRDPAEQELYLTDPLILRDRVQESLFVRLADGLALLPGRASSIDVPILLIHGDDDPLCSAEGARMYVEQTSSGDVTVRLYPGGRHELLNDINRDEVEQDIFDWIDSRL